MRRFDGSLVKKEKERPSPDNTDVARRQPDPIYNISSDYEFTAVLSNLGEITKMASRVIGKKTSRQQLRGAVITSGGASAMKMIFSDGADLKLTFYPNGMLSSPGLSKDFVGFLPMDIMRRYVSGIFKFVKVGDQYSCATGDGSVASVERIKPETLARYLEPLPVDNRIAFVQSAIVRQVAGLDAPCMFFDLGVNRISALSDGLLCSARGIEQFDISYYDGYAIPSEAVAVLATATGEIGLHVMEGKQLTSSLIAGGMMSFSGWTSKGTQWYMVSRNLGNDAFPKNEYINFLNQQTTTTISFAVPSMRTLLLNLELGENAKIICSRDGVSIGSQSGYADNPDIVHSGASDVWYEMTSSSLRRAVGSIKNAYADMRLSQSAGIISYAGFDYAMLVKSSGNVEASLAGEPVVVDNSDILIKEAEAEAPTEQMTTEELIAELSQGSPDEQAEVAEAADAENRKAMEAMRTAVMVDNPKAFLLNELSQAAFAESLRTAIDSLKEELSEIRNDLAFIKKCVNWMDGEIATKPATKGEKALAKILEAQ